MITKKAKTHKSYSNGTYPILKVHLDIQNKTKEQKPHTIPVYFSDSS